MLLRCYYAARVTKFPVTNRVKKSSSTTFYVSTMPRKRNTDLNRKEPVRLRQKRLKNGGYSLYLDIYWNGKRSYEFQKLYLNPPSDDLAVIENKTTLELAKQIKYKRILELPTGLHGRLLLNLVQNSETSLQSSPVKKFDLTTMLATGHLPSSIY